MSSENPNERHPRVEKRSIVAGHTVFWGPLVRKDDQKSLLIVSGDEESLLYLKSALKPLHIDILTASSGAEACRQIASRRFSIVLADLELPDRTGLDVLKAAGTADPLIVGLVLAPHSSLNDALEALRAGAFDYLLKSAAADVLQAVLRRSIEHSGLKHALAHKTVETARMAKKINESSLLIQNVSHELKNPLTVVHGYTSFLLQQEPHQYSPEDLRKNLQSIHKNAKRLEGMVDDLLESSRLSGNKVELQRTAVSAGELASEAAENARFDAMRKEIEVKFDAGSDGDAQVHADSPRVQQILANLLTNAVKFTPEGGTITVSLRRDEGFLRFCVGDTGVGISPEDLPRLFERFYQVDATRKYHRGLGLGLDICKSLVELHGGKIWAESVPGHGSSFYFTLPLSTHPVSSVERRQPEPR